MPTGAFALDAQPPQHGAQIDAFLLFLELSARGKEHHVYVWPPSIFGSISMAVSYFTEPNYSGCNVLRNDIVAAFARQGSITFIYSDRKAASQRVQQSHSCSHWNFVTRSDFTRPTLAQCPRIVVIVQQCLHPNLSVTPTASRMLNA